jgi:hypothetical protein
MLGKIRLICLLLLICLLPLLAGCSRCDEQVVFQDVLKSDCASPCWRGIMPGSTNRTRVLELLGEQPNTDTADMALPTKWGSRLEWGTRCLDSRYSLAQVTIGLDPENVVESITLVEPDRRYTFQNVFDEAGPPTFVLGTTCSPDSDQGIVYLVYPQRGLAVGSGYVPVLGQPWQQPRSETRIYQQITFEPMAPDLFSPTEGPIYGCGMPYANGLSPWQGFAP